MNPIPSPTGLLISRLIYYAVPCVIACNSVRWMNHWWPYAVVALPFLAVALISRNQKLTNNLRALCRYGYTPEVIESQGFWELFWCCKALRCKIGVWDCWAAPIIALASFVIFYVGTKDAMSSFTFSVFSASIFSLFNMLGERRPYRCPKQHIDYNGDDDDGCGALVPANPRTPTLAGRSANDPLPQ